MIRKLLMIAVAFCCLASYPGAWAQSIPALINYQGKLVDASGVPLGTANRDLTISIYDAPTGGNKVYGPQAFLSTPVVNGYYNLLLGPSDTANPTRNILDVFGSPDRYLEVTVGSTVMSPRQRILSAPFAIQSSKSTLSDGVKAGAVTGAMLANDAVGSAQIAAGAVTGADIAAGAVGSTQIANGSISSADLASNSVGTAQIINGSVTTEKLAAGVRVTGSAISVVSGPSGHVNVPNTVPLVTSPVNALSATLTLDGNRPVWVSLRGAAGTGGIFRIQGLQLTFDIYRDAAKIQTIVIGCTGPSHLNDVPSETVHLIDLPTAGTHTYSVKAGAQEYNPGSFVQCFIENIELFVVQL